MKKRSLIVRRLLRTIQGEALYYANLGFAFGIVAQYEEAEEEYRKAIKLEPDNAEHQNGLGDILLSERGL